MLRRTLPSQSNEHLRRWQANLALFTLFGFGSLVTIMPARADQEGYIDNFPGGVKVTANTFDPRTATTKPTTFLNSPDLLASAINTAWNEVGKGVTSQKLKEGLHREFKEGMTLYDIDPNMASLSEMRAIDLGNNKIGLKLIFRGNTIRAHSTTPDIALGIGVGKYADPALEVTYDLELKMVMTVPNLGESLRADELAVKVSNAKVDAKNASGEVIKAIGSLIDFLGGPDFKAEVERNINATKIDITKTVNRSLAELSSDSFNKITQLIQGASSHGTTHLYATIADGRLVISTTLYPPDAVYNGLGTITGAVRWAKDKGYPASRDCSFLKISASVQSAESQPMTFEPPMKRNIGQLIPPPVFRETNSSYECHYTLSGLPYDIGLRLEATGSPTNWVGSTLVVGSALPSNWSGWIKIQPPLINPGDLVSEGKIPSVAGLPSTNPSRTELNPQPLPPRRIGRSSPSVSNPVRSIDRPNIVVDRVDRDASITGTSALLNRKNPSGRGSVSEIDFDLSFGSGTSPVIH
ncbi:hypothetical protein LEP3755_29240 [Leptolyngbya sp. NIES-3755]|nr:hypothetical protein LEP3755_29240 [Leptolyngbya sp. NIES-3755]